MTETRRESSSWKAKHSRIISAALDEFIAKGVSGASMDRIALKAKVSKVTIYNHFDNKKLLYQQALDHFFAHHKKPALIELPLDSQRAPEEILVDYGIHVVEMTGHQRTIGMIQLLRSDPARFHGVDRPDWEVSLFPDAVRLAEYLEHEKKRFRLRLANALVAARQFHGMLLENTVYPRIWGLDVQLPSDGCRDIVVACVEVFLRAYAMT